MRIRSAQDFSFKNHLQKVYYANDFIEEEKIKSLLSEFSRLNVAFNYTAPLLFAIDYVKSEYIVMTGGAQLITGHDPRAFLESGIPMLIDIYQKDDFRVFNEDIFTRNTNFLAGQPQSAHHQFIFSYNFRVRHNNGKYIPIFQRGCYVTSKETGLPLYSLGMVLDISMFKNDSVMYHSIEKVENTNGILTKVLVEENHFFPCAEDKILSVRERKILSYMAEGFSSKQIAGKLNISENTVSNHRKNMLKKTNTKNVAELISFALRGRLID